jgi:hypothetical protein
MYHRLKWKSYEMQSGIKLKCWKQTVGLFGKGKTLISLKISHLLTDSSSQEMNGNKVFF